MDKLKKVQRRKRKKNKIIIASLIVIGVTAVVAAVAAVTLYQSSSSETTQKNSDDISIPTSAEENDIKNESKSEKDSSASKDETQNEQKDDKKTSNESAKSQNTQSNNFLNWNRVCEPALVVINKDNSIPQSYKMNLVDYMGVKINSIAKDDLENMVNAAANEGLKIYPSSGYRSIARQTTLFNNQVERCKKQGYSAKEAESVAATVVARPGTSEHHTGLAIDFNGVRDDFYKTKEYAWLIKNATNYGFILRYPKDKTSITSVIYEPWHFRYVGKEYAKKVAETGLCYEEYVANLV